MKNKILFLFLIVFISINAQTTQLKKIDSLFLLGRYKIALQELNNHKDSYEVNVKKAAIYESIDAFQKAVNAYEKALVFKADYKTKLKLSNCYRRLKQYEKAIKIYEDIVTKDSLNLVLQYQLGKLYILKKRASEAVKTFSFLTKKDIENANYSYHLGLSYALLGKRDPMINSFIETYKRDTLHLKAISKLAKSFRKLNDIDSTQLFVKKGLTISPNNLYLNSLKIDQLYYDKKYTEAIPLLIHLDTLYPKEKYASALLGRSYYHMDSLELAKKYFKKLSKLDREDFKANTFLGHIDLKEKKYMNARLNYSIATFKGKQKRDEEYYGLGTVFYETKKPKEAIKMFEKAYMENRKNYRALYQYAKLSDDYYKDKKIAYKLYKRYLETVSDKDEEITAFVKKRVEEIKKQYFLKGERL